MSKIYTGRYRGLEYIASVIVQDLIMNPNKVQYIADERLAKMVKEMLEEIKPKLEEFKNV